MCSVVQWDSGVNILIFFMKILPDAFTLTWRPVREFALWTNECSLMEIWPDGSDCTSPRFRFAQGTRSFHWPCTISLSSVAQEYIFHLGSISPGSVVNVVTTDSQHVSVTCPLRFEKQGYDPVVMSWWFQSRKSTLIRALYYNTMRAYNIYFELNAPKFFFIYLYFSFQTPVKRPSTLS